MNINNNCEEILHRYVRIILYKILKTNEICIRLSSNNKNNIKYQRWYNNHFYEIFIKTTKEYERFPNYEYLQQNNTNKSFKTVPIDIFNDWFAEIRLSEIYLTNKKNKMLDLIFTFAHEYGHYLSDIYSHRTQEEREYIEELNNIKVSYLNIEQKEAILKEEIIAWKLAEIVLNNLNNKLFFKIRKKFYLTRKKCLKTYFNGLN